MWACNITVGFLGAEAAEGTQTDGKLSERTCFSLGISVARALVPYFPATL